MEKNLFLFLMVFFVLILLNAIVVGYDVISSYKENYSQVEYASETNERFYQEMVKMKKNTTKFYNGFPTCLTGILSYHTKPGDEILATKSDTLYLVDWDLNRTDINKYPYYVVKDNYENVWTLFRHNDKFRLTREDETKYKEWFKKMEKQTKSN
jgi:hypothetical protein